MSEKTHWRLYHPTEYIGAADFQPGERKIVTIKNATSKQVDNGKGKKDTCLTVEFREDEKPLIVNVTNSKAISKVAGSSYIEDWAGTAIELFTTEVSAFGEMVEAVRVKPSAPKTGKPTLTTKHNAYSKVVESVSQGYTRAQVETKYSVSDEVWSQITQAAKGVE